MLFKHDRIEAGDATPSPTTGKMVNRLVLAAVVLAAAVVVVAPAAAHGVTPAQLSVSGWDCFVRPIGEGIVCANPGLGRPPRPAVPDGRPAYMFLLFDSQGTFVATELLIRADLYRGQLCGGSGAPYVLRAPIGYYECVHP